MSHLQPLSGNRCHLSKCSVWLSDERSAVTPVACKAFIGGLLSASLLHTWLSPQGDESVSYLTGGWGGGGHVRMYEHTNAHAQASGDSNSKPRTWESGNWSLQRGARSGGVEPVYFIRSQTCQAALDGIPPP